MYGGSEHHYRSFSVSVFGILAVFTGLGIIKALTSPAAERALSIAIILISIAVLIAVSGMVACAIIWTRDRKYIKGANQTLRGEITESTYETITDKRETGPLYIAVRSPASGEVLYYRRASERGEIQ